MKTFGELKKGDFVYSLNQKEFGVLTKILVKDVTHDGAFTSINIGDYNNERQYYPNAEDVILKRRSNNAIYAIAPSLEGVKEYWKQDISEDIDNALQDIKDTEFYIGCRQDDYDKICNITE